MNAKISNRYRACFNRQGLLMTQVIVMSVSGLIKAADRAVASGNHDPEEFQSLVKQLMNQRRLAAEVLDAGLDELDWDEEAAAVRQILDELCHEAEFKVLSAQAELARRAGRRRLADRIDAVLSSLNRQPVWRWDGAGALPVPAAA